ncbi:O-antigen ligase family protein [Candidatus Omnitrophota bacterium]
MGFPDSRSGRSNQIIIFLALAIAAFFIGRYAVSSSQIFVMALVGGLSMIFVTILNTNLALMILIVSMLFSPEIPIAQVPDRAVVIRIDDILLIFMFLTWMGKMAMNKELSFIKKTPLNRPFGLYIFVGILATALALALGLGRAKGTKAFFYILKMVEYFMVYFMVINNLKSKRQAKIFIRLMLSVAFLVCICGLHQVRIGVGRIGAPFEGKYAEPNTLAGYLILMCALASGMLIYAKSKSLKFFFGGLALLIFTTALFTFSRGGYLGFLVAYLALLVLNKRFRVILIMIALIAPFFLPAILPQATIERVTSTFIPGRYIRVLGEEIPLELSVTQRVDMFNEAIDIVQESPLFGHGITGAGLKEGQIVRVLAETGIVGLIIFLWMIVKLFKIALRIYRDSEDDFTRAVSLGFLVGFIGLLAHSWSASVFLIVRIMEPFWFLAAIVTGLPQLAKEERWESPQEENL